MNQFIFIDLFSGAGGVTTGIEKAESDGFKLSNVIAAVNHDDLAIQSHTANHPHALHYVEDIRTLDLTHLKMMVEKERIKNPESLICLWASAECTNFSRAKGGLLTFQITFKKNKASVYHLRKYPYIYNNVNNG